MGNSPSRLSYACIEVKLGKDPQQVPRASMVISKYLHCVLYDAKRRLVYALGGNTRKACEAYCIASDKWKQLPDQALVRTCFSSLLIRD